MLFFRYCSRKVLFWKKSILEGQDLAENVCKIWKTICEYQIHGGQKEIILWVLKHDFGAHKKVGNLFQHIPLNTLVVWVFLQFKAWTMFSQDSSKSHNLTTKLLALLNLFLLITSTLLQLRSLWATPREWRKVKPSRMPCAASIIRFL